MLHEMCVPSEIQSRQAGDGNADDPIETKPFDSSRSLGERLDHVLDSPFRSGLGLVMLGCLPFAGGALAGALDQPSSFCPFRFATGLPCPLCGGTRAFALAANGDERFLSFNAFWVLIAVAAMVAGLLVMIGVVNVKGFWSRGRVPIYLLVGLLAGGWGWALLNHSTITG